MAKFPGLKLSDRTKKRIKRTLQITAAAVLIMMAAGVIYFITLINSTGWAQFDPDKLENQAQTLMFYDKDGNAVGGLSGGQNRTSIPLAQMPQHFREAVIAAEDTRFYEHMGVDLKRILGALWADIRKGEIVQGASTISQQLIKNTHLTNEQTWSRKLQEARLALQLEQVYTKDEILEMYLNTVYFGYGAYGIEAAAQSYFGKPAGELTLGESALLAGVLKGSAVYAPHLHLDRSVKRRDLILTLMEDQGFITEEEMKAAKAEEVRLKLSPRLNVNFGYYLDAAVREAEAITGISNEELVSGGYKIHTTMDSRLQLKVNELMASSELFPPDAADGEKVQGALVVLDSQTGGVRAVAGGREYTTQQGLNRATSSRRQPGSSIKPVLVYGPAIDRYGYNPATMILDEPADFNGYKPQNSGGSYSGWITLRQAVVRSINVPAVRVLNDIGLSSAKDFASRAGIAFDREDDSLAIGLGGFTRGVTPFELASAYTVFANAGRYSKASFISRIEDEDGTTIYTNGYQSTQVCTDATAFIMTDILHNAAMSGTARLLNFKEIPLAAKTGTVAWSAGNKDVWLASYNPEYVVVSWMGFDKTDSAHHLPSNVTGGTFPAQICKEVYLYLYGETAAPKFSMPDSVTLLALDNHALQTTRQILLASAMTPESQKLYDYFPKNQAPTQVSQYWQTPITPTGFNVTLSERSYPVVSFLVVQDFVRYDVYRVDAYGRTALVTGLQGASGTVLSYEDYFTQPGTYLYYVSPVHPQLNVTGSPTSSVQITVPGESPEATGTPGLFDFLFPPSPEPEATATPGW